MLLTTYLPQDQEVHSWLSQELRGNKHTFSFGRKWTDRFQSSCIHQKYVPGKWCCSRGNFTSIIFMRREWPQEKKKKSKWKTKNNLPTNSGVPNMFLNSFPKSILWANPKSMILIRGLGTFLSKSIMFSGFKKKEKEWSSVGGNNQKVEMTWASSGR